MQKFKSHHEKLVVGIQEMLMDYRLNLPYYGEFCLMVNFHNQPTIETCAINVTNKGMNFYYNPEFLDSLTQKQVNFVIIHELFHLLFKHPMRTVMGNYDHKLSNIVQDMIINHIIWQDITHHFVEIPKNAEGKNMALFVPKEYKGRLVFEPFYEWMQEEREKRKKKKEQQNQGDGGEDSGQGSNQGKPDYGPYGQDPSEETSGIDTHSLDKLFDDLENGTGEYLDKHINDTVSKEIKDAMVRSASNGIIQRLKNRGLQTSHLEQTLNKLQKKRKDYLREIKRAYSNEISGTRKERTIMRPNRKGISGLKGTRKVKNTINVILDVSGSMGGQGTFEKVLSYVYQDGVDMNFIQADTEVKWFETFKRKKQLQTMKILGLGGTVLQPAIDKVAKEFNKFNTVILTDGMTDSLDFTHVKGRVLIITTGMECPISRTNGKVRHIHIAETE
jgi:predicted metal-dependent peptidase